MAGVDITSIKELLGHKSLTMTMRYAHLSPGHKRKAVDTLDRVLTNNRDKNLRHNFVTVLRPGEGEGFLSPYMTNGDEGNRTPDLPDANGTLSRSELRPHSAIIINNRDANAS